MLTYNEVKNKNYIDLITDLSLFIFILTKTGAIKSTIVSYAFFFLFVFFIGYKILNKKKITITKYSIYYTIFGSFSCASYTWAMNKSFVIATVPSIVALVIFIITLANYINSPEKLLKLIKYTVIANIIVSIKIIILYWIYNGTAANRISLITGIYFNTVAQVIGFSIIFSIYLYKIYTKNIYLIMIIPQFLAILLTGSRKAMIIPVLGIILILLLKKMKVFKKILYCMIILLILFIGIFTIKNINNPIANSITEKFESLIKYVTGQETNDWSINLRQFFIDTGIDIFKKHPIKGIGLNNFAYYVQDYTNYGESRYSHNNYIEILSCLGIIGFVLYYWIYIYIFMNLFKSIKRDRDNILLVITISANIVLMIMEWGIVSYTGCMYHVYISIMYYTLVYKERLLIKDKKNAEQNKENS